MNASKSIFHTNCRPLEPSPTDIEVQAFQVELILDFSSQSKMVKIVCPATCFVLICIFRRNTPFLENENFLANFESLSKIFLYVVLIIFYNNYHCISYHI